MKQVFRILSAALCAIVFAAACDTPDSEGMASGGNGNVVLEAAYLGGEYCGKVYETPSYNYYLVFSDKGFTKSGEYLPNARYYYVDVYSPVAAERGAKINLPVGAYAFDKSDSFDDGTISMLYSHYYCTDESAEYYPKKEVDFADALLIVRADGEIELDVTLLDGSHHKVSYHGDYDLPAVPGSGADGPYTTLTQNTTLDFSNAVGMADYYGDYFGKGYAHWVFMLAPKSGTGDALQVTMMSRGVSIDNSLEGLYTCSAGGEQGTFYPGVYDYGDLMDSWYCYMQNRQMPNNGPWAPLVGGTISITKGDDGQYTVALDCLDDGLTQNRITGSWHGEVSVENRERQSSLQAISSARRMLYAPRVSQSCFSKPRR